MSAKVRCDCEECAFKNAEFCGFRKLNDQLRCLKAALKPIIIEAEKMPYTLVTPDQIRSMMKAILDAYHIYTEWEV